MKIQVVNVLYLKSNVKESQDLYALDIKFLDEKIIKVGDVFLSEDGKNTIFKVKSLAIGSYDFKDDLYSVQIEKPSISIEKYKGSLFAKQ